MTDIAAVGPSSLWKPWTWKLHWQILLGLLCGVLGGWALANYIQSRATEAIPATKLLVEHPLWQLAQTIGDMFLAALKMIVIPLVLSSIILSIASIAGRSGFAQDGNPHACFLRRLTGIAAILIGIFLVNTIRPGVSSTGKPLLQMEGIESFSSSFNAESEKLKKSAAIDAEKAGGTLFTRVLAVFKQLIPSNIFKSMVDLDLLGIIVWAILFGFFTNRLAPELQTIQKGFWQGIYEISLGMTELVLRFAPIGVMMLLIASLSDNFVKLSGDNRIGEFGTALSYFAFTVVCALAIHAFGVMSFIMYAFAKVNPIRNLQAFAPALLTAFSTASSNATISVNMECAEKRAGVSNDIASFVIPLGATVNMNGTALYECVAALFVVQLFGFPLDISQQFMVVLISLLTSVGVAGVPSASLVAILIILDSVSKQIGGGVDLAKGLPILLILDRPLDMCRTAVNVFGDACGAVYVAKMEGEDPLSQPIVD
jgi:proton glutamate symport protein